MKALISGAAGIGVQIALIVLGAGSLLVFARDGFHVFLHDLFHWLVYLVESLLGFLDLPAVQHVLRSVLDAVEAWAARFGFEIDLVLQTHWKHASVLLWLVFGSHAQALADFAARPWASGLRNAAAAGAATTGGLMAGTVHLGHPGVLWWPASALLVYLGFNALMHGALEGRGLRRIVTLLGAGVLAAGAARLAGFTLALRSDDVLGNASPSDGLRIVILATAALGTLAVVFGFGRRRTGDGNAPASWAPDDPGRRMGLRVLATLGLAALVAGASQAAWALGRTRDMNDPRAFFRDCLDCPEMARLPAGRLRAKSLQDGGWYGDSSGYAEREISISAFAIARREVTVEEFRTFSVVTGYRPSGICWTRESLDVAPPFNPHASWRTPGFQQAVDHPVVCVTWWDAQAYARWLSLTTGKEYRLPSDSEWDYAARGGTITQYFWGDDPEAGCSFANVADATANNWLWDEAALGCDDGATHTAPVGAYLPNPFGLYDMAGNAQEWVEDCGDNADAGASGAHHPCLHRVLRGGSWRSGSHRLRSSIRERIAPTHRSSDLGFRVARTV